LPHRRLDRARGAGGNVGKHKVRGPSAACDGRRLIGVGASECWLPIIAGVIQLVELYPNGIEPAPRKRRGIAFVSCDARVGVKEFDRLNRAIGTLPLTVPIAKQFRLDQAAQAHRMVEKGHVLGRVVLRVAATV
jgi:NADPH:quinone reductase-like Zn-dependent oxidoreductase